MEIYFTRHARLRMAERRITEEEIEHTLLYPDRLEEKEGLVIAKKIRKNGHLLGGSNENNCHHHY